MELRARAGRAVLAATGAGEDDGASCPDPGSLPLGAELVDALHEWAQVAQVVERVTGTPVGDTTGALVTRRGKQLARLVAAETGTPVHYVDPVTGQVLVVDVPAEATSAVPAGATTGEPGWPAEGAGQEQSAPAEPTPWATGLTVSAFAAAAVLYVVLALSMGLAQNNRWLAVVANVVIAGGLAPSVWLARRVPVWRWAAYGVAGGIAMGWVALLLGLL